MTWAERWAWPELPGADRDARLLQAVAGGQFADPQFVELKTEGAGHVATWSVMADAFRVGGPDDYKRAIVTHRTAQAVADLFGWRLPSAKLLDAIAGQSKAGGGFIDFAAAVAGTQDPSGQPYVTTSAMVAHSDALDEQGAEGLIGGGWKDWILSARLLNPAALTYGKNSAVNYGYFTTGPLGAGGKNPSPSMTDPSLRVWQQPGAAHDVDHVDVSQKARFIGPAVHVAGPLYPGGRWLSVDEVSAHPVLWELMHHDGPQPARHPWLPVCQAVSGGGCVGTGGAGPPATKPPPVTVAGYDWGRLAPLALLAVGVGVYWIAG